MKPTCPGCGRNGKTCWRNPCTHLQWVKVRPIRAMQEWLKATGGRFVLRLEGRDT